VDEENGGHLVDAAEVAGMLRLSQRNSVSTYQHRYADFPRPVIDRGPRKARFWRRDDIITWQETHQLGVRR
jgi:hypothetical protein